MVPEERDDPLEQILASMNCVAVEVFPVVVTPPVDVHPSHSEELAQLLETVSAARALRHNEVMRDLVSGRVASPPRAVWLPHEADREASFSVYKTDHPATELDQPFLLVFRTRHVVTVDSRSDVSSSAGYTGFSSIWPDAHRAVASTGGNVAWRLCTCLEMPGILTLGRL